MPRVYIINDPAPNAFATGRDPQHSSVAVTTGLLERLDKPELEGVIAHELSHVGNYDIRLMMIVVVLVGVIAMISDLFIRIRFWFGGGDDNNNSGGGYWLIVAIVAAILAPIIATLIQLAISRKREFLADSSGALLTRYPEGLASALEKISLYKKPMQRVSSSTSHLFIANPFGKESYFSRIFSTHPPIEERIAALKDMEK
jgi:heat shock protein HtpX